MERGQRTIMIHRPGIRNCSFVCVCISQNCRLMVPFHDEKHQSKIKSSWKTTRTVFTHIDVNQIIPKRKWSWLGHTAKKPQISPDKPSNPWGKGNEVAPGRAGEDVFRQKWPKGDSAGESSGNKGQKPRKVEVIRQWLMHPRGAKSRKSSSYSQSPINVHTLISEHPLRTSYNQWDGRTICLRLANCFKLEVHKRKITSKRYQHLLQHFDKVV